MNILVIGNSILAIGPWEETEDTFFTNFATYPKRVIDGYKIVEATLPSDYAPGKYQYDGGFIRVPDPAPTLDEYTEAVQNLLDTTAQDKHYDNIISCCSYAGAPNAFQAEGQAAIEWRGNVWATCYSVMAQVQSGTIPAPTIPELLAMLPVMVWP